MASTVKMLAVSSSSAELYKSSFLTGSKYFPLARNTKTSAVTPAVSNRELKIEAKKGEWLASHSFPAPLNGTGNALRLRLERERRIAAADGGEQLSTISLQIPEEKEAEEELSRGEVLWRAAKLPIYTVAIVPLSVGGAVAFWQTGVFNATRYWLMFWSSILIITWLNLSNDAYDWETGVDLNKRESVVNITGSQKGVLRAALGCLLLGFSGLVFGASRANDMRVAVLLAAAIGCGYIYQCPPFRLSYKGLGEPLCFLAFGPLATTAFYLGQGQPSATAGLPVTLSILGASVLVGITTSLILFCSHFHQIEGDFLAGKLSPLVRMGTANGSKVVQTAVTVLYLLTATLTAAKAVPPSCAIFSLLTLPIGKLVLDFIRDNHSNKELIFMAKYYAVRLHVAFGVALVLGFSLASRLKIRAVW
ncbi:unnamed protein product [Calypogeia fissa]